MRPKGKIIEDKGKYFARAMVVYNCATASHNVLKRFSPKPDDDRDRGKVGEYASRKKLVI